MMKHNKPDLGGGCVCIYNQILMINMLNVSLNQISDISPLSYAAGKWWEGNGIVHVKLLVFYDCFK